MCIQKICSECGRNIRRLPESIPYQVGICSRCGKNNDAYQKLVKASNRSRQRKFYRGNKK